MAAITLGSALDGIEEERDPGPPATESTMRGSVNTLPRSWLEAIDRADTSPLLRRVLGDDLHRAFVAIKRAEHERLAVVVSEAEWDLYGFVV